MTIELHIKRANLWYNAADEASELLNPLEHGYHVTDLGIIPRMVKKDTRPPNLKDPCSCQKCATKLFSCRSNYIGCIEYCKCPSDPKVCRNFYTKYSSDSENDETDDDDNESNGSVCDVSY